MHNEKKLARNTIFEGKVVSLHVDEVELENGSKVTRELVEHPGGVAVLALDSDENVMMVRQYRYGAGQAMLELPAGKLNYGEDPAACGLRELEEETGYAASKYSPFMKLYPTPAYDSECIHIYLARELSPTQQRLDDDELLTVERVPFEEALKLCMDGMITDAKTLAAILKYSRLR